MNTMNIYAKRGDKVILSFPESGWPLDQKMLTEGGLVKDGVYTIDHTDVFSSSTNVYLLEFPGVRFNSVNFSDAAPIVKGSIVKYKEHWYRTSHVTKRTANLCGVFRGKVFFKAVPLTELVEDDEGFMKYWSETETYRSM